jgi:hypothetical protein
VSRNDDDRGAVTSGRSRRGRVVPAGRENDGNGPQTGPCDLLDGGMCRWQGGRGGFRVVRDRCLDFLYANRPWCSLGPVPV